MTKNRKKSYSELQSEAARAKQQAERAKAQAERLKNNTAVDQASSPRPK